MAEKREYDHIAEYCVDWVRWCETRKFYIRPPAKNILARMQPAKTGREPNARNHPDMQYFNMAIHTLADMPKYKAEWEAFKSYYFGADQVAKRAASDLGIGLRTYYDHVKRFSHAAYAMAGSLKKMHEAMTTSAAPGAIAPPPAGAPQ